MSYMISAHIEMLKDGRWEHATASTLGAGNRILREILTGTDPTGPAVGVHTLPADASVPTRVDMDLCKADGGIADMAVITGGEALAMAQARYRERVPEASFLETSFEESVLGCYVGGERLSAHRGYDDVRAICWLVP